MKLRWKSFFLKINNFPSEPRRLFDNDERNENTFWKKKAKEKYFLSLG